MYYSIFNVAELLRQHVKWKAAWARNVKFQW